MEIPPEEQEWNRRKITEANRISLSERVITR
jgi:hypothetical protein